MTMEMTPMQTMTRTGQRVLVLGAAGILAGVLLLSSTGTARADYGNGAVYQIEISGNCTSPTTCIPAVVQVYGI